MIGEREVMGGRERGDGRERGEGVKKRREEEIEQIGRER